MDLSRSGPSPGDRDASVGRGRGGERAGGYRPASGREKGNSPKDRHVAAFAGPEMATLGAEAAQLTVVRVAFDLSVEVRISSWRLHARWRKGCSC